MSKHLNTLIERLGSQSELEDGLLGSAPELASLYNHALDCYPLSPPVANDAVGLRLEVMLDEQATAMWQSDHTRHPARQRWVYVSRAGTCQLEVGDLGVRSKQC